MDIKTRVHQCAHAIGLFIVFQSISADIYGADTGLSVEFLARPAKPAGGYGPQSLTGHTYIILKWKLNSGIKEEVFGFYPAAKAGRGLIKGPGLLRSEYRCTPSEECSKADYAKRLGSAADTVASTAVPLTDAQYRAVRNVIAKWTTHDYDLIDSNCISFLQDVVTASGYEPPPSLGPNRLPANYVAALDASIKAQDRIREEKVKTKKAEEKRKEAEDQRDTAIEERDAAIAAKEKAEAEARRAEAEARRAKQWVEANTIPAGWVACTCPSLHAGRGKVVNGTLYHPAPPSVPLCGG